MKLYRLLGAILLISSGYFAHAVISSSLETQLKAMLFVVLLCLAYLGLVSILSVDKKSFKENFAHGFDILMFLP